MDEHVFGKYEAGSIEWPSDGGLLLYEGGWQWFRPYQVEPYSTDPYGLQEATKEEADV